MKILLYSSYFYPYISGLTTYPETVLKHLSKKNDVTVLTFRHSKELRKEENYKSLKIRRMPFLFRISKGFISPQSLFYFWQEAKKNDAILLVLPNFEALMLAIFGRLFGKKVISIFLCQVDLGHGFYSKFISFFLNLSMFFQMLFSKKVIAFPKYSDDIFFGKFFKHKIETTLPPIRKLPISKNYGEKLLKEKGGKEWIGFCGRIAREKGIETLVSASKILKNKGGRFEVVFAGPYGDAVAKEGKYYLRIKELLNSSGVPHRFLGQLSEEELGAFLKTIDILVLPSANRTEAFGMVQAEAMILGTPVVSSNMPGVNVPVELTNMGVLFSKKDSPKLARSIEKVLGNSRFSSPEKVQNAQKIFDQNKVFEFYEKIISS